MQTHEFRTRWQCIRHGRLYRGVVARLVQLRPSLENRLAPAFVVAVYGGNVVRSERVGQNRYFYAAPG